MTDYRRDWVKGGTYFFTVNLADRKQKLLTERIDALRGSFREIKQAHPFQIDAICDAGPPAAYAMDFTRRRR